MAVEIDFENGRFRDFDPSVTLTLTSDDLESGTTRFVLLSPIHTYIVYMGPLSFIVDGRTHVRTYVRTDGHGTGCMRSARKSWPKNSQPLCPIKLELQDFLMHIRPNKNIILVLVIGPNFARVGRAKTYFVILYFIFQEIANKSGNFRIIKTESRAIKFFGKSGKVKIFCWAQPSLFWCASQD